VVAASNFEATVPEGSTTSRGLERVSRRFVLQGICREDGSNPCLPSVQNGADPPRLAAHIPGSTLKQPSIRK
jgi:hypothetical protein